MQTSPRHYQQLQPEDRVTMASLLPQNHSLRDMEKLVQFTHLIPLRSLQYQENMKRVSFTR